jgi:Tol biopolymer transport system component
MPDMREVYDMVTRQRPPEPGGLERQWERQRRALRNRKLGAIGLSAALAGVVALFVLNGSNAADQPNTPTNTVAGQASELPSQRGVYLLDLQTKQATPIAGSVEPSGITVSSDGTMIAYESLRPDGTPAIYVADLDGGNARALQKTAATGATLEAPRFSPDGAQIVYQAKDNGQLVGDLFVADVATGETTQLTHLPPTASGLWYMGPTFGPDGRTVFFTRPSNDYPQSWSLWSVPTSGGKPRLVLRNAIGGRLSPDGQTIVYFRYHPSLDDDFLGDMWLANADGTDARRLGSGDVFSARWSPDGTKIAYLKGGSAYVVDVTSGEIARVLEKTDEFPEWLDDDTWIIGVG